MWISIWRRPPFWILSNKKFECNTCSRTWLWVSVKFGANAFNIGRANGRVMAVSLISKWRPPPSWIYFRCLFLSFDPLSIAAGDVSVKFHNCSAIYGWLIQLSQKIQNGGCRYHELLFGNPGPPTKSRSWSTVCVKISCQSLYCFKRCGHLKILKICLKCLFPPPKLTFLGVLPLNIIFHHRDPQKALPCGNRAFWAIKHRDRSSGMACIEGK